VNDVITNGHQEQKLMNYQSFALVASHHIGTKKEGLETEILQQNLQHKQRIHKRNCRW